MVFLESHGDPALDLRLRALADPIRRDIVRCSLAREWSIGELAQRYPVSLAATQKHVAVLERAGLIHKRAEHRHRYIRCDQRELDDVVTMLETLRDTWTARIDRFEYELGRPTADPEA
jgi:DNA-binding transcriptional ArsR family regulator